MQPVTEPVEVTKQSRWVDLDGPMHYVDHGGPAGADQVVLVHGLGGSHANWSRLAPLLAGTHRVLVPDLAGFGLTVGGPRSAAVPANRRLLDRFLTEVTDGPVTLVGNSMGGLITAMQAAERPESVSRLVLVDPALPIPLAKPDLLVLRTFGEFALPRRARKALARRRGPVTVERATQDLLDLVLAHPEALPQDLIDEHVDLARRRSGDRHANRDFIVAAQSLAPFLGFGRGRVRTMLRSIRQPVLLLQGDRDRLVHVRAARIAARANPSWQLAVAHDVGHVPMLEAPEWTRDRIEEFLAAHPVAA
jgi:pimeloyl-ACP methyl ester carboxylesterase